MFWGLTIEPGKHYTQTVEESFHVSMAALETRDVASPERDKVKMTQLMVQHDKAEFLVCTLCYASNIFQQYLDLNFTEGEEVTFFSEGRATIHLTGYLVRDEPLSMDPDMMSMDEVSSSDEAASNSEGLASGEESSGEARVKGDGSCQLQRGRQRRRSPRVTYSDVRQRQRKQLIWEDRQLCPRKREAPPLTKFKAKFFIGRKRNVFVNTGNIDDVTLRRKGQRYISVPSKGSPSCQRSLRVSKEQSLLTSNEENPSCANRSETPSVALQSTALAPVRVEAPMPSSDQETIYLRQPETAKTSSTGGRLESYDLTRVDTNSPSPDEQANPLTTLATTSTIAQTNMLTTKHQLTRPHATDKGCTSYTGYPGKRKEIRHTTKCLEKRVPLLRGTIPVVQSKHRGVFKTGRLNYHPTFLARFNSHSTRQHSGQSSFNFSTASSYRKRTQRGARLLTSSRGQPIRHSHWTASYTQPSSESAHMRGGSSQPVISNVVGGPEVDMMTRMYFENTSQNNDVGQRLSNRELHTDGGNSQVSETHNPPVVEIPQEQRGQSSAKIFQAPLTVKGVKEEQSGSTNDQVPSMGYTGKLVPTSLVAAYPEESNPPPPQLEDGTQALTMPEMDSVYWSCMSDDPVGVTGAGGHGSTDGIPVASDMTSLTAFDLGNSGINMPDQKIRLAHGYDVFIMRRDLLQAERTSKQSWSIFVRRLLDVLFDRVTLAMGRASNFGASHSDRTPLDQNVVGALKEDDEDDEEEDNEDEGDGAEMSLQQLAMGDVDLEDEDDDDDIDEWKPKNGKTKRKKQQKKTNSKRQHVEEIEPRKAKKLAELEIRKSDPEGSDDEDDDDDYTPVIGALEDGEDDDDVGEEDSDDFIGWELDDEDDDEDEDEDSEEDDDALYDEDDSDYDEDVGDLETAIKNLRSKNDTMMQLKTKSTEKQKRVLRAREATPPKNKMSPVKSSSKKSDAGNKENIDRPTKQQRSSPGTTGEMSAKAKKKTAAHKTPDGKTPGTSNEGSKTRAGKVTSRGETLAVETPGDNPEVRQSPRGKTPVQKPELKTPSGKTPGSVTTSAVTPGKSLAVKAQGGSTPGKGEAKTPKGKGNEMKTPNTQKGKGDAVKTPKDKSAKKENSAKQQPQKTPKKVKLPGGTTLEDLVPGDGKVAKSGKMVFVYYRGLLPNGKEFDSCLSGKPFMFRLGKSEVIKGWDEGIAGMKVGGKRKLTIPPSQGYGHQRAGIIPANSTLMFNVELKNVK